MSEQRKATLSILDVFEYLGYEFHLDWDDSLEFAPLLTIDTERANFLADWAREQLASQLRGRHRWSLHRFYGGPLDGIRHGLSCVFRKFAAMPYACRIPDGWHDPLRRPDLLHRQCEGDEFTTRQRGLMVMPARVRQQWACYEVKQDGRAFFLGYATSEDKARCGRVIGEER